MLYKFLFSKKVDKYESIYWYCNIEVGYCARPVTTSAGKMKVGDYLVKTEKRWYVI